MNRHGTPWTDEDYALMRELYVEGWPVRVIAPRLGRSHAAVCKAYRAMVEADGLKGWPLRRERFRRLDKLGPGEERRRLSSGGRRAR